MGVFPKQYLPEWGRPSAKDDILRQFRYYLLEDAFEAAARFLDAVDESIEAICQMPDIGAPKQFKDPLLAGLRSSLG
jgi:plasmid stabilization system protein ParE